MARYKQKQTHRLLSSVLYINTLWAPILVILNLLYMNSRPAVQAPLPPLPTVGAACSCCKIVRPSELNYMLHRAD